MKITLSEAITLATGHNTSTGYVKTSQDSFNLEAKTATVELEFWNSKTKHDEGYDKSYAMVNGQKLTNLTYTIPQADVDQALADGHTGIIGEHHQAAVIAELETLLGHTADSATMDSLV